MYNAISSNSVTLVKEAFEMGADSNYCKGDMGWLDSNPLDVLTQSLLDSFYQDDNLFYNYAFDDGRYLEISNLKVLDLLLSMGADIHKRPYIWNIVNRWGYSSINFIKERGDEYGHPRSEEVIQKHINSFISDANNLLKAYLEAGADPDKLGHPYPYTLDAIKAKINDEQANEYFSQGTRAINEAIKKGIVWESQVDLLLQYTKLDEDSLLAAKESGDPLMIEKINKLWEIQQSQKTN